MEKYEGKLQAKGLKIAVVVSRFNGFLTERLLEGALDALTKLGADPADVSVYKVPGAFEIPIVVKKIALASKAGKGKAKVDGVVCLGALVRGETPHFDFLSAEVTKGIAQISLEDGLPATFGILTVDTIEQGIERAGAKSGNKGWDAVLSLVETVNLIKDSGLA
jgi:6,7-dimethyl-8-ribityllumazine synthase